MPSAIRHKGADEHIARAGDSAANTNLRRFALFESRRTTPDLRYLPSYSW
jgi:hypothetical protein